jgi:dTDP-4-dehydrorhamnose reductase
VIIHRRLCTNPADAIDEEPGVTFNIKRILLLSADGMLGTAWGKLLTREHIPFDTANFPAFDITKSDSIAQHVIDGCDVVVNCCAYTAVDKAETEHGPCDAINAVGVGLLAARCKQIGATLIHYSTDYVFNGRADSPYCTDTPRDPVNYYGKSKADGEALLERSGCRHLLIRTSWLYAPWGKNFVLTMGKLMSERPRLTVVNDQRGRPTSAEHLAASSLALLRRGAAGAFHVTDGGECTWFQFASEIGGLLGTTCEIAPCTTDQYPTPAKRPAYSVLDLSKTIATIGMMPDWKDNLRSVMDRITG